MLVIMFGSTAILPPRTKRWAEAKVLADCINVKVCDIYNYNPGTRNLGNDLSRNEGVQAVSIQ